MKTSKLDLELISQAVDEEVWRELSNELAWSEQMLEKYQDYLDWERVSENSNIVWTVSMLEKFKDRIDWKRLSRSGDFFLYSAINLEQFKNYWDWEELSDNCSVPYSFKLIDLFVDYWDWSKLINCDGMQDIYGEDFLELYEAYIPASRLQETKLWAAVVENRKMEITAEIAGTIYGKI